MKQATLAKFAAEACVIGMLSALAGCQANTIEASTRLPAAARPAEPDAAYQILQGNKAQALSVETSATDTYTYIDNGRRYTNSVANQPSPVAAALQALNDCEQARAVRTTPSSPCEIRRKGDVVIHSAAELNHGLENTRPALLWQLSAANRPNKANVYVGGSIHVLKPSLRSPPSYTQALGEADVLVFEIDESELSSSEMQALVARYGNLPEGQTLDDLMNASDYKNVVVYATGLGVPEAMIRQMKPAMLLLQAGVLEYISMGYLAQHGVEAEFRANKSDREILALEKVEQQLAAATALPLPLQAELLLETIAEIDTVNLEISNLVRAWLAGDEQQLDALFNDNSDASPAAQQWMNDLLTKRNIGMAEGVIDLLQSDRTYFVLVGAAHLVGDDSVIALLRDQGVTATRLRHDSLTAVTP